MPPPPTALIELAGIERVFRLGDSEVHALHELDLRIDAGEYVAVMGPSGSGKSTLLNLLGLLDPKFEGLSEMPEGQRRKDLRDALGTHMHLHEGADCFILSPLEPSVARATARYVTTTRQRIDRLLAGMAHFPVAEKSILLVLDDEDTYYHYVAQFYGSDGEFARSGGMFIHFGCPHFVVVAADLAAIEPVIAHEMTHSALAHLHLPTWLDEGLAVNTERRLKGAPPAQHTPAQLHHLHQRFWTPERMQEFWAGTSFQRTDDGNLLSYELARILVDHMARDWAAFTAFVTTAQRRDAGAQAAVEVLSVDLGSSVGALLDIVDNDGWAPDPARWGGAAA